MGFKLENTNAKSSVNQIENKSKTISDITHQKLSKIPITKIVGSEYNFYSMDGIEDLVESIRDFGLISPIVVHKENDNKYVINSGHRRFEALKKLDYKYIDCIVREDMSDIDFQITLIHANKSRVKSPLDTTEEIKRLKALIKEKKKLDPSFKGKVNEIVGDVMNLSSSQVNRYANIDKLIPEIKEMIKNEEINPFVAERIAKLDNEGQEQVLSIISDLRMEQRTRDKVNKIIKQVSKVRVNNEVDELKKIRNSIQIIRDSLDNLGTSNLQKDTIYDLLLRIEEQVV